MKKAVIFSLIVLILALSLASFAGAQNTIPSPVPWPTDPRIPAPVLQPRVPRLPISLVPDDYVPSKLTLSEEEKDALKNIQVGQRVTLTFYLPFFLQDQVLLWETSNSSVIALSATSGNIVDLIAVGSGEAEITIYTAEGTFFFKFTVVVP